MEPDELYHEEISFFWGKLAVFLFFGLSITFAFLFFYQRAYGPVGQNPPPDWFYIMMFCFFLLVAILILNFQKLTISMTQAGITASYGRIRKHIHWEDVASYQIDEGSALKQYGGYGIRFGWRSGGSVLVYNTTGGTLVLLELKRGKYKYFSFSTRRPDEVTSLIRSYKR